MLESEQWLVQQLRVVASPRGESPKGGWYRSRGRRLSGVSGCVRTDFGGFAGQLDVLEAVKRE